MVLTSASGVIICLCDCPALVIPEAALIVTSWDWDSTIAIAAEATDTGSGTCLINVPGLC